MQDQELELIQRVILTDDQHAFRSLVLLHQSTVRSYLRRWTKREEWADELAQEVFLIAYQKIRQVKGSTLRPWLLTIAYRLACQNFKGAKQEISLDLAPEQAASDSSAATLARLDIERVLCKLQDKERQVLEAWAYEGMSHGELAVRFAEPLGSIKSRLLRAQQKLKAWLE
jgi:RNA polymerase sigma-70 factor (ECF subfamily)